MNSRKNRFPGSLGPWLVGQLELPDGAPRAAAVLSHCFTCGKDLKSLVRLARELARRGIACLRYDVTGIGESEGDFAQTSFSSNVGDVVAAAGALRHLGHPPRILVGHSLGGAATLVAARRIPEAGLVATIAAPSDTAQFARTLRRLVPTLESEGEGEIVLGGRRFPLRRHLLDDLAAHDLDAAIADLGLPLLVFQSPDDDIVPAEEGERLFARARGPKNFVALDGADHLMLAGEEHTRYVASMIAAFAARYGVLSGPGAGDPRAAG